MQKALENPTGNRNVLVTKIDGRWMVDDFVQFFERISFVYRFAYVTLIAENIIIENSVETNSNFAKYAIEIIRFSDFIILSHHKVTDKEKLILGEMSNDNDLMAKRIFYASPGSVDLAGFGKAIEETSLFIRNYLPNIAQRIANEKELQNLRAKEDREKDEKRMRQLEQEMKTLEIFERKIAIFKSLGANERDLANLKDIFERSLLKINGFAKDGRIINVDVEEG